MIHSYLHSSRSLNLIGLLSALALAALTACGTASPKEPRVQVETASFAIGYQGSKIPLSYSQREALDAFMQSIPVSAVTLAVLSTDIDNPRNTQRTTRIRNYLIAQGVMPSTIRFQPTKQAGNRNMILLTLQYARILPPAGCPDWSQNPVADHNNLGFSNFGCAYNTDLARQMTNPADYESGQGNPVMDGARESIAVQHYLSGASGASSSGGTSGGSSSSGSSGGGGIAGAAVQ